jgi:hypothetical protein
MPTLAGTVAITPRQTSTSSFKFTFEVYLLKIKESS